MSAPLNCELNEMVEENRFVYNGNKALPSLQKMASFQVALAIWNGYISRCSVNEWGYIQHKYYTRPSFAETFGLYSTYQEDTDTLVDSLKTPRRIERILKTSLEKVRRKMERCVHRFYHEILFCHYPPECGISTFKAHWCVWLPNGKIDYLKTAEIMVSSENKELKLEAKFVIMCEFYMEEKLKKFPMDSLSAESIEKLCWIQGVKITAYWVRYLDVNRCEEIDAYKMVAECILFDGIGGIRINHFWHRLSEDDQVKALYAIFVKRSGSYREKWKAVEPLFGSMSWDQQQRLLSMPQASEAFIINSCRYSSSSKCATWAWRHCRDVMSGEEFWDMIPRIFQFDRDVKKDILPTLVELWDLAYDHHRNAVVNEDEYFKFILRIRNQYSTKSTYYTPATYIMLIKSLALKSMNERKALIMKFSDKLTAGTPDPHYIQEILDLNIPNINDQNEYKTSVLKSEDLIELCIKLWNNGDFDLLNENVEFYCNGNASAISECKQKLLSKITSNDRCGSPDADKLHKCCEFFDEILPNEAAEALFAKQRLVSHFLSNYRKNFNLAIQTIESLSPTKLELNWAKAKCITADLQPKNGKMWESKDVCNDVYFHSMIEWCCDGNKEAVRRLKSKIQTHNIMFDTVFFQLNKVYVTEAAGLKMSLLTGLNKYLSWYLASEDEIMAYKMHRLNESHKLSIFTAISKRKDKQSLKILLEWFCDGDEAKICDFRPKINQI